MIFEAAEGVDIIDLWTQPAPPVIKLKGGWTRRRISARTQFELLEAFGAVNIRLPTEHNRTYGGREAPHPALDAWRGATYRTALARFPTESPTPTSIWT